jgi:hypothetical protein
VPGTDYPLPAPLPAAVAGPVASVTGVLDAATRAAMTGAGVAVPAHAHAGDAAAIR